MTPTERHTEALATLVRDAIEAVDIGGHSHWRAGGSGGVCSACDAATNKRAELHARLDAITEAGS